MIYVNTIRVLIKAIWSLSWSVAPDFSPNALDQIRQSLALTPVTFTVFIISAGQHYAGYKA